MDHFLRIIQHLSCTRLLLTALNPSLSPTPLLYLLSFSHGSRHSRLSERFLCTERLLSHCGSVKWGSYLSSLNVSKRIGNQWCIPVHENFSVNLISPPTYLFVHLAPSRSVSFSPAAFHLPSLWWGNGDGVKYFLWGEEVSGIQKWCPYGNNFYFPVTDTMVSACPGLSVMFNTHYTEHGWLEYFCWIDHGAAVLSFILSFILCWVQTATKGAESCTGEWCSQVSVYKIWVHVCGSIGAGVWIGSLCSVLYWTVFFSCFWYIFFSFYYCVSSHGLSVL